MGGGDVGIPPRRWPRLSIIRWLSVVAVAAIALHLGMDRFRERRGRLLGTADTLARIARDYRDGGNLGAAAWYEHLSRGFAVASERPWVPIPAIRLKPPPGWSPPPSNSSKP